MKIVFALFHYFPFGGLQCDMMRFAEEAAQRGHEILILTGKWEGDRPVDPRIKVEILPVSGLTNAGQAQAFERRFLVYRARHPEVDVFVAMNRMAGGDFYFAADNCLLSLWHRKRDWSLLQFLPRFHTYLKQEAAVFAQESETRIWHITQTQKEEYQQFYQVPDGRFQFLGLGMNLECRRPAEEYASVIRTAKRTELGIRDGEIMLLLVAYNLELKGADRLLQSVAALPEKWRSKCRVVLAGDDSSRLCRHLAAELPDGQVIFAGPRHDVPELLLAADLMVHPARLEATGTVIIEALAAGLPVIASGICGYTPYAAEVSPLLALPEPFDQNVLNNRVVEVLEQLPEITRLVRQFAVGKDFNERSRQAVDSLEHWVMHEKYQNHVFLRPPFDRLWQGKDPFEMARRQAGQTYREVKSRRTLRFEVDGKGFFLKYHGGTGWREIFKNWIYGKEPVLGAGGEFNALDLLHMIGVPTMTAVAFGEQGRSIAAHESFLITEELADMVSMEDYCRNWRTNPPSIQEKRSLIHTLATMVGKMHRAGLNHRDCYLCHFLRDAKGGLWVIDLHRAQIRSKVPHHYLVKDLGGLLFSALDAGLTRSDCRRFVETYSGRRWLDEVRTNKRFWMQVLRTGRRLYRKEHHHSPPELL